MADSSFHSFYYSRTGSDPITSDMVVPAGTKMDEKLLKELIDHYRTEHIPRYEYLAAAFDAKYEIFGRAKKEDPKPDQRLAADMAYDITETFEGYFIGIPPDIKCTDKPNAEDYLKQYAKRNNQDDVDADLSEMASKFGHSYEMLYQDDSGKPRSVACSPLQAFMVYDDSVLHRPLFFVRFMLDAKQKLFGTFSDAKYVHRFKEDGSGFKIEKAGKYDSHSFGDVPAVEYLQNTSKRGLYEGVLNLIEAYNSALSEKANDVEYFSDAYLVIVSAQELTQKQLEEFRESKIINLYGPNASELLAKFLEKPDADSTQENLLNRLEMLIFKMSMVPDITDETFSTASGIALKMRMMPMSNLARKKEIKFISSMMRRFKLLANYPKTGFTEDDWEHIEITMHRNMPEDIESEAQVAGSLMGIVSQETALSTLSIVNDPAKELQQMESERDSRAVSISQGYPTNRAKGKEDEGKV